MLVFTEKKIRFTEKRYDLPRNAKIQKCRYVLFFKKKLIVLQKLTKHATLSNSLVLSRNLLLFLSIFRFILSPYNGSGNGSIRRENGSENDTSTRRGTGFLVFFFVLFCKYMLSFLVFFFSFVNIVLMYEWLNIKIKRNVDRFFGFSKTNGRKKISYDLSRNARIYREKLRFIENDLPRKTMIYRENLGFTENY